MWRVDAPAVLRGARVLAEVAQVAAAGYDVGVVDRFEQHGDAGRLVLAVAVHRHQHVVVVIQRVVERRDQGRPVAAVLRVRHDMQARLGASSRGGAVGRAVVDDEDVGAVSADLGEDAMDVRSPRCRPESR